MTKPLVAIDCDDVLLASHTRLFAAWEAAHPSATVQRKAYPLHVRYGLGTQAKEAAFVYPLISTWRGDNLPEPIAGAEEGVAQLKEDYPPRSNNRTRRRQPRRDRRISGSLLPGGVRRPDLHQLLHERRTQQVRYLC